MPFKSEKQRKWMWANDPKMAAKWEKKEKKMKREQKVKELIKKMVREEMAGLDEAAKRDYKAEYKKFQSSDKSKKYRAELNKYNSQKGTYGNGDGKDASHKGGKIVGFEKESVNRGRAEKSRLKKEEKLTEVDFDKIKLPSQVNRFLDKFVQSMKGANLNRMKRASILYKVIDAAGMTPQQLMADIQKIKTAMKEEKLNERLHVVDERYVGKYIIWVLQDGNKIRTAVLGKKGFDNFSSNDPDDLKKLWNLTKKFKGKPIPDIATEGTCGYGENGELGEEPAGPHLIKKKLKEAKETIFDVAARVMKDKQAYGYNTKKGLVTVDVQTANLLTKVFKKVNPKMKKILSDLGYKSPTQLMNTLWAVVK